MAAAELEGFRLETAGGGLVTLHRRIWLATRPGGYV